MLDDELSFLAAFPRNFITGLYPGDIAVTFISGTQDLLHKLTLPAWADGFKRAGNGFAQLIGYGLESAINTVIIFMCRLAILCQRDHRIYFDWASRINRWPNRTRHPKNVRRQ